MRKMRRKTLKTLSACLLSLLAMSGCSFSEECSYVGDVEVLLDWDALWKHLPPTSELTAVFYGSQGVAAEQEIKRGSPLSAIPSGEACLLVYNPAEGIELKETGGPYPELRQATYYNGTDLAVRECPMICVGTGELTVPVGETLYQLINPLPVVRQLTFTVTVLQRSGAEAPVSAEASLGGVYTGYSIVDRSPIGSSARVFFPLTRGKDGKLSRSLYVLGLNPDGGQLLNLSVPSAAGEIKVENLDLNKSFKSFTADRLLCEIKVDATVSPARVSVSNLEQDNF